MEMFIAICRLLKRRVVSKWAKENNLFTTFKKKSGEIMMSTTIMFSCLISNHFFPIVKCSFIKTCFTFLCYVLFQNLYWHQVHVTRIFHGVVIKFWIGIPNMICKVLLIRKFRAAYGYSISLYLPILIGLWIFFLKIV